MQTKQVFLIVDKTGKKRETDLQCEADRALKSGFEVYEQVEVWYNTGPTAVYTKTTTPW